MFCLHFGRYGSLELDWHGHHVTCALIGTNRKLAGYDYTSSLVL